MLNTTLTNKRRDVSDRSNNFIDLTGKNLDQIHNSFLFWEYHVKTGKKKQCKHQAMRSEFVAKSLMEQVFKVKPNNVREGLKLERSDDFTCVEYYLKAYCKDNPYSSPIQKRIGRIIETESGFMAAGMRGLARGVYKQQKEGIDWILHYVGRDYEQIKAAYKKTQKPVEGSCRKCGGTDLIPTWDNEPILCKYCGWVERAESILDLTTLGG